jgi:hypothetical protein
MDGDGSDGQGHRTRCKKVVAMPCFIGYITMCPGAIPVLEYSERFVMKSCGSSWLVRRLLAVATLCSLFGTAMVLGIGAREQVIAQENVTQETKQEPAVAAEKSSQEKTANGKTKKKATKHDRFVRINKDEKGRPVSMDTSTIRYTKKMPDGTELIVDLVGVVHIGEKDYYSAFNEQFKNYDALLYELVAPEGTKVDARNEGGGVNPVAALQKGMMAGLDLQFQLEHINYNASNFVHADMTPEEFGQSMTENNESVAKMFFRMMGTSAAMSGSSGEAEMLRALMSSGDERTYRLRRSAASQLIKMDVGMVAFEGDNGSTIITHRNGKAFKVLQAQIDAGKRKLGVFYGAGHLPDMERRLIEEFGMTAGEPQWQVAWKLRAESK